MSKQLTAIVTVTDVRIERILRRAHWPLRRLGPPREVGTTRAVAGLLDVSGGSLARLRIGGDVKGPVLWAPVDLRVAASVPACMATRHAGPDADGTASPSGV